MIMNIMKVVSEVTTELNNKLDAIRNTDDWEQAKRHGMAALGFVDCFRTMTNAMICKQNNEFTGDLGDLEDIWYAKVYQAMVDTAIKIGKGNEVIIKLCELRDEYRC